VSAAVSGDFNPLLAQNLELADDIAENLAVGMHLSVICAEDIPRITREDLQALNQSFFGRALVDALGSLGAGARSGDVYARLQN